MLEKEWQANGRRVSYYLSWRVTDGNLIFFSPGKIIGNLEHMKSEMGNMSETLKAMKNSATECGGQFQKRKPCKIYEFFESC